MTIVFVETILFTSMLLLLLSLLSLSPWEMLGMLQKKCSKQLKHKIHGKILGPVTRPRHRTAREAINNLPGDSSRDLVIP